MTKAAKLAAIAGSKSFSPAKNLIVNPIFRHSQEHAQGINHTASGVFPADQWYFGHGGHSATVNARNVTRTTLTPGGSYYHMTFQVATADTSQAAGEYMYIRQSIEGRRMTHLGWGTDKAQPLTLRFGVNISVAGTYSVSFFNANATQADQRAYIASFTISADEVNTDVIKTITVPGQTQGIWRTDEGTGIALQFVLAAGSTFRAEAGTQTGNILAVPTQTNLLATTGATYTLFDVGLYVGENAPEFVPPLYEDDLRDCQRYYAVLVNNLCIPFLVSGLYRTHWFFPEVMRANPTVTATTTGGGTTVVEYISRSQVTIGQNNATGAAYVTAARADARLA